MLSRLKCQQSCMSARLWCQQGCNFSTSSMSARLFVIKAVCQQSYDVNKAVMSAIIHYIKVSKLSANIQYNSNWHKVIINTSVVMAHKKYENIIAGIYIHNYDNVWPGSLQNSFFGYTLHMGHIVSKWNKKNSNHI